MKLLGHVYIALECFPEFNKELLAFGALLPETVFYTKRKALSYEQIHEGGLELFNYCIKSKPEYTSLALGCMSHSVIYGADKFNDRKSLEALGYSEDDIPKIADAVGLSEKLAVSRSHNLYDLALDRYIFLNYPTVLKVVESTRTLDKDKVSTVLADCYNASKSDVHDSLVHLWDKYDLSLLESYEGLAKFWKILASDLKEKDPVDIEKTAKLLEYFYTKLVPGAQVFLDTVVDSTKTRIYEVIKY